MESLADSKVLDTCVPMKLDVITYSVSDHSFQMEDVLVSIDHFYWSCCPVCVPDIRNIDNYCITLKACSRCRHVFYCGKEHQRLHWKTHRRLCSYLSSSSLKFESLNSSLVSWREHRVQASIAAEIALGRNLINSEREVFLFPKNCRLCRTSKQTILECQNCLCVAYCSPEHQQLHLEKHKVLCEDLKMARICDELESKVNVAQPHIPFVLDTNFKSIKNLQIMSYLSLFAPSQVETLEEKLHLRFLSDRLSAPLTLLMTIERFEPNLLSSENLLLHIIGANAVEVLGLLTKWEFLLHRLHHCLQLTFVFIGPELPSNEDLPNSQNHFCGENRNLTMTLRSCGYKQYCRSEEYEKPDLAAVFNCGFHEHEHHPQLDTWQESLPYLLHGGSAEVLKWPHLVFTSYTLTEAQKDLNRMKTIAKSDKLCCKKKLEIRVNCEVNPFRSHRPVRDFEFDQDQDVFYNNQYYSVVQLC